MPEAIPETMAKILAARLSQITVSNGYECNATVVRGTRTPVSPGDNMVLVATGEPQCNGVCFPGNPAAIEFVQPYSFYCCINPSKNSKRKIDELLDGFVARIRKAVATVTDDETETDWARMDGNAVYAEWGETSKYAIENQIPVAQLTLNVTHRVSETDPYTVR